MTGAARGLFVTGALLALCGVAAGAFGAHWLRSFVPPDLLAVFETGARYQMYHSFALMIAALTMSKWPNRLALVAGRLFVLGILLFSGSLYIMALTGIRWLGAITPLGGVAFLAGWSCLALAGWRSGATDVGHQAGDIEPLRRAATGGANTGQRRPIDRSSELR